MEKVLEKGGDDRLKGKILASLFYEPSTRTRLSFESAMQRLGGQIITADGIQFSSLYKGESIEDTIIVAGQYADIICMRHPEEGSADRAASVSPVPFINAGDGPGQHPTQALLDLLTVQRECGRLEDLAVTVVGDLKYGRAARSFVQLLALYPSIRFTFVAPDALAMPSEVCAELKAANVPFSSSVSLDDGLDADVIYMTRVQKERFKDEKEYARLKDSYVLTAAHLKGKKAKVLHPLPRVNEIARDVDPLPNAAYFRQVHSGVLVRMALLDSLLRAA
jgi:aspartate carbamoyltransferase catalytic subunit